MKTLRSLYRFLSPRHQSLFLEYKVAFKPRYGHGKPPHPQLYDQINAGRAVYEGLLRECTTYASVFHTLKTADLEKREDQPAWNNGFFPGLDMVTLYTLLAVFKPQRYVEIGSGNSTKIARKAIQDQKLATRITSIDPFPRASIDRLADEVVRMPLENLNDISFIDTLEKDDILFIDNSHRCLPNSDVTVCFLELIPRLKKGVIVHIHDIYLPYDYPQFMCDRFYSEQYLLAMLLLSAPEKYQVLLPNYFISEDPALRKIVAPVWNHPALEGVERHGGSFWFRVS